MVYVRIPKSFYTKWKNRYMIPRHNKRFILVWSRFFLVLKHNSQELSTSSSINQQLTSCLSAVKAPLTRQYLVLHQTICLLPTCPWAVWVCLVASSEEILVAPSIDDDAFCSTVHDNLAMLEVLVEASCTNARWNSVILNFTISFSDTQSWGSLWYVNNS